MVRILPLLTSLIVLFGRTPGLSQSLKASTRIVGGVVVANKNNFPYFALINSSWDDENGIIHTITCGGSLITSTAVLVSDCPMPCFPRF